jgi:hypothetical protein
VPMELTSPYALSASAGDKIALTATKTAADGSAITTTATLVVHYPCGVFFNSLQPSSVPGFEYTKVEVDYLMIDDALRPLPGDYDSSSIIKFLTPVADVSAAGGCPPGPPITSHPYLAKGTSDPATGTSDPTVFLVVDGTKYGIVSADVFNSRGFNWDRVIATDPAVLAAMPDGAVIA